MIRLKVPKNAHEWRDKAEHFFHASYLGFTAVEAHGWHANAAGVLFVVVVAGVFIHAAD